MNVNKLSRSSYQKLKQLINNSSTPVDLYWSSQRSTCDLLIGHNSCELLVILKVFFMSHITDDCHRQRPHRKIELKSSVLIPTSPHSGKK